MAEEKAIAKVGGDRIETHVKGHGTPGAIASGEARKKRKRRKEQSAAAIVDGAFDELQVIEEGIYSLTNYAKKNNTTLGEFYTKIWGKRIPTAVSGEDGGPLVVKIQRL